MIIKRNENSVETRGMEEREREGGIFTNEKSYTQKQTMVVERASN